MYKLKATVVNSEFSGYPIIGFVSQRNWTINSDTINELVVSSDIKCIKEFIFDTSDFDFCKVTYDGKTLSVSNPESIIRRSCIYYGDKEALKYEEPMYEDMDLEERLRRLYNTYTLRLEKYESRGFNVVTAFDFGDKFKNMMITNEKLLKIIDGLTILLINHNMVKKAIPSVSFESKGATGHIDLDNMFANMYPASIQLLMDALKDINCRSDKKITRLCKELKTMLTARMPNCVFSFYNDGVLTRIKVTVSILDNARRDLSGIDYNCDD
jgi:hypothetical protein